MSPSLVQPLPPRVTTTIEPIWKLTVEQHHGMIERRELTEDDAVELLEGVLVWGLPKNELHSVARGLVADALRPFLPPEYHDRTQEPVRLRDGEPEPDWAAVRGKHRDYSAPNGHPTADRIAWVVEIADTSLERDRAIKLRSYARAGIAVYWIVNLIDRCVEVYTDPAPELSTPSFRRRETHLTGQSIPVMIDGTSVGEVRVSDFLP
jgi:Uma2 family endonuclease